MDPNTHKNLMGAAGAGGGGGPVGQFMLQGYCSDSAATTVTYDWTVPDDVTSISAVCVGGGEPGEKDTNANSPEGGAGGDLRYVNDIAVTPGETLEIGAAIGWQGDGDEQDSAHSGKGGPSWLKRSSTSLVFAEGGNGSGTNVGTGEDGDPGGLSNDQGGGGGGAGGYTASDDGQSAAAGNSLGRHGGGIGLTGNDETPHGTSQSYYGSGGAYGEYWNNSGPFRGCYGGGGGGNTGTGWSSMGAPGAVRIIWGEGRSFPSNAQGVFPTADAGTELSIKWMNPVFYDHDMVNTTILLKGLEIFDDTGTNLVASSDNGDGYDGMTIKTSSGNNLYDLDGNGAADFDDLSAGETTVNWMPSGQFNRILYERFLDTDYDGNISTKINHANHTTTSSSIRSDEDEFLTGENHNDNTYCAEFLFKFASAKVIKKIHFYTYYTKSWVPRCRIHLDGNLIADDSAHFIDPDTDEGHNAEYLNNRLAVFEFT
tara:strand:- start:322 stop:1770 length:1449 start_codon:yes stop_codon:yes gene_type:complete